MGAPRFERHGPDGVLLSDRDGGYTASATSSSTTPLTWLDRQFL
ncbi:hypothetical protein AB0E08_05840 [Streptomyces sp. NPDC048281]